MRSQIINTKFYTKKIFIIFSILLLLIMLKNTSALSNDIERKDYNNDFYIIVASDPQYPRTTQGINNFAESERLNRNSVISINNLKEQFGEKLKFAIINGDLTEYGHDKERKKFNEIYSLLKLPAYIGLGNHDYANNVEDCWSTEINWITSGPNGCASQMLNFLESKIKSLNPKRFDHKYESNYFTSQHSGSWSYSWDFNNVHFVQLNNYPSYQRYWTLNLTGRNSYNITSSLDWLEDDIITAKKSIDTPKIIINLHDPWEHWEKDAKNRFKKIIEENNILTVFAGHFHNSFGKFENSEIYGNVPLFLSGALFKNNFFLVHFSNEGVTVQKYNGADGIPMAIDNPWVLQ